MDFGLSEEQSLLVDVATKFGEAEIAPFVQALQFRLVDVEIDLQAARTFLRQAAWKLDTNTAEASTFCAMAKKLETETGSKVADHYLQLHGGYGYLSDYGIEKLFGNCGCIKFLKGQTKLCA